MATVGHGEAAASTIGGNIHAAVIAWIPTARPSVPWREDRADKADDRNGARAIIADTINIPPGIAARGHLYIKVRSLKIAAAACLAESVAIGTPAPGCAPPPTRYSPLVFVLAVGRAKAAIMPCGDRP